MCVRNLLQYYYVLENSVRWTEKVCSRNRLKTSDVHVVLFNSHNGSMAGKFKEAKFPSICLIESNLDYANLQKVLNLFLHFASRIFFLI